jgi:hypothetical protein
MRTVFFLLLVLSAFPGFSQEDEWEWWNKAHNWREGMPGWRLLMILSPAYLGPNALPVPEMKKGIIQKTGEIETTLSNHFYSGDPTQDLSAGFFLPFGKGKIAFEGYGVILEHYNYTDEIRDIRVSRDKNGRGFISGDFYFSTLVQLCRNHKFPDTVFRIACKTASGNAYSARYTDTPGYFFDFSFSKEFTLFKQKLLRPYAAFGFYSWQTYNEATPQNDALLYGAGLEYRNPAWCFSGDFSGYSGYLKNQDRPQVITLDLRHDWPASAARIRFLYGLRDWNYKTVKFSFIWKLHRIE